MHFELEQTTSRREADKQHPLVNSITLYVVHNYEHMFGGKYYISGGHCVEMLSTRTLCLF